MAEARALCKPFVSTNFTGATEQLQNMKTGILVSPSAKEIADAIEKLIVDVELRNSLTQNLERQKVSACSMDFESIFS